MLSTGGICLGVINPSTLQWECRDTNIQQQELDPPSISGQTNTFSDYALLINIDEGGDKEAGDNPIEGTSSTTLKIIGGAVAAGVVLIVVIVTVSLLVAKKRRGKTSRRVLKDHEESLK